MKLLSVNVGRPRQVNYKGHAISTGIYKSAVTGPVHLRQTNLEGDGQADLTVHGGVDKAVYVYPAEHYPFWEEELNRNDFTWGQFGENFTVENMSEADTCVGDVFRIGSALLQVTQPREPCYKLGIRMENPDIIRMFLQSGRTGYYLRVLEEGEVVADNAIERVERAEDLMSVRDLWRLNYFDKENIKDARRAFRLPALSSAWRLNFQSRLF
jgi:MOSC domain-containing protein YiiM